VRDSPARTETYSWARRNGMHNPYDFAICHEESWGDQQALREVAFRWELRHLKEREAALEEEVREAQERLQMIRDRIGSSKEAWGL